MSELTREQIEKLDTLYANATPGPWRLFSASKTVCVNGPTGTIGTTQDCVVNWPGFDSSDKPFRKQKANAKLIAALVTAWPNIRVALSASRAEEVLREHHKLDTPTQVFFYEQDFYVLSNFSAFRLGWQGHYFDTSEAAYHWEKFPDHPTIQRHIMLSDSAHGAFKLAERYRAARRKDWDAVKVDIMRCILYAKAEQHEYVCHKLLATGNRELIEDSSRDDFWGWGPNRDGQNMLGKLWMEIRAELAARDLVQQPEDKT